MKNIKIQNKFMHRKTFCEYLCEFNSQQKLSIETIRLNRLV